MYRNTLAWLSAALLGLAASCVGNIPEEYTETADAGIEPNVDADPTAPDANPFLPDANPFLPDANPFLPDANPAAPDAQPGPPDASPSNDCYSEPLFPDADVADLVSAYGGSNWKDELIEAMDRRWPAGAWLLDAQRNDSYFGQFSDSSSWSGMVGWLDTLTHEETHLFNAYHAMDVGQAHSLYYRDDLIIYLPAEAGFPRSEIYSMLAPGTDGIYASYLQGTQGERGFNALLDELSAYSNEVPAVAVFGEYYPGGGVSLRDGSAAFLYYLQLYLRRARTAHESFYQQAKQNPSYVDAVKYAWLRVHFFYELADQYPELGINDDVYRNEMHQPENLAEIQMFIGHAVGDSSCLLD